MIYTRKMTATMAASVLTGIAFMASIAAGAQAATGRVPQGKTYTGTPPVPAAGTCHARGVLPDPRCTPGATNPAVTQADIASTICRAGYSSAVRPPESYTEALKHRLMASYGDRQPMGSYELDHLVSLELGGAPSDPRNLWPEYGGSPNRKDKVENAAHRAVCEHHLSLAIAQYEIATDWPLLGKQLGLGKLAPTVPKPPSSSSTTTTTSTTVPAASTTSTTVPAASTTLPAAGGGVSNKSPSGNYYRPGEYCPTKDLGKTITDPYGTMTCEVRPSDSKPRWM